MTGIIIQIITSVTGGLGIFLRAIPSLKGLGLIFGCISCPCWVLTEIYYKQWYILPINILYIWGWYKSTINYLLKGKTNG